MARTVIDIDEEIFARAQQLTGLRKKVDLVNYALARLVEQKEIEKILGALGGRSGGDEVRQHSLHPG